jgi:hypothetical protein
VHLSVNGAFQKLAAQQPFGSRIADADRHYSI